MTCNEILTHIMNCDECRKIVRQVFAANAGRTRTKKKSEAARLNGLKGGRPRKEK